MIDCAIFPLTPVSCFPYQPFWTFSSNIQSLANFWHKFGVTSLELLHWIPMKFPECVWTCISAEHWSSSMRWFRNSHCLRHWKNRFSSLSEAKSYCKIERMANTCTLFHSVTFPLINGSLLLLVFIFGRIFYYCSIAYWNGPKFVQRTRSQWVIECCGTY